MNIKKFSGLISIVAECVLVISFVGLAVTFNYPRILHRNFDIILQTLYDNKNIVPYLFYTFGISGFLISYASILIGKVLDNYEENIYTEVGKVSGIIYGVLLFCGITRYTKLFPYLSEMYAVDKANKKVIELIFNSFNYYVGSTVTEHCAFMFLCMMILFFSVSIKKINLFKSWISISGFITSIGLFIGNFEFLGFEKLFVINRIFSSLAGIWLLLLGIVLIIESQKTE